MYLFIGAGSTPLHYAACGGNLKCCQARVLSSFRSLHSYLWFLRNLRWLSYYFCRSYLQEVRVVCLWTAMGISLMFFYSIHFMAYWYDWQCIAEYAVADRSLYISSGGCLLMLLGCGGAIGSNRCWHPILTLLYQDFLLPITYPCLFWVYLM